MNRQLALTLLGISLGTSLALGAPMVARAQMSGGMFMSHNGSTIQEFSEPRGNRVEFRYASVRPGLPVREGAVLFRGRERRGDSQHGIAFVLSGTAYVFKRGCPPAPYAVRGRQTNDRVVLRGAAPMHARGSCQVITHDRRAGNAILRFDIAE